MATYSELKQRLDDIETRITAILKTGKNYSLSGSHSVENPELSELRAERSEIRRAIIRHHGYHGRTTASFE